MNKVTLEEAKGRVLYVRCHKDTIPGPYVKAFDLEEIYPGVWEAKIAMESMTLEQRRDFTEAVESHGGISKIIWTRYLDRGIVHRETSFKCSKGNFAKTIKEKQNMATRSFVVSWKLINDETGKQEAAGSLESNGRALTEVRHMQNLLKSGYQEPVEAIGDELAAAQAAA